MTEERLPVDPARVVVSTVFENRLPYSQETVLLYASLEAFGGRLSAARRIAYCIGPPDDQLEKILDSLDVEVRVVETIDPRCPHANKLHMFRDHPDADVVVALDTDTVIARDFTTWLTPNAVQAKATDMNPLPGDIWVQLWGSLGLPTPLERHHLHFSGQHLGMPYFNSGVVTVPTRWIDRLHDQWLENIGVLLDGVYDSIDGFPENRRYFTDQYAFAAAVRQLQIPHAALPVQMNFPLNFPVDERWDPHTIDPFILHHHHKIDATGLLEPSGMRGADAAIDRINRAITGEASAEVPPSDTFDNAAFWDNRYRTDPKRGSGIGSRGELAIHKRQLVRELAQAVTATSILDVGCGDMEVLGPIVGDYDYCGIDVSEVVLERNRLMYPDAAFMNRDFTRADLDPDSYKADLVLCLDVLIHQHDEDQYRQMVDNLVRAARCGGVIAGYNRDPEQEGFGSDITAFHEPLVDTLQRCGMTQAEVVDTYRGTDVVVFAAVEQLPDPALSAARSDIPGVDVDDDVARARSLLEGVLSEATWTACGR